MPSFKLKYTGDFHSMHLRAPYMCNCEKPGSCPNCTYLTLPHEQTKNLKRKADDDPEELSEENSEEIALDALAADLWIYMEPKITALVHSLMVDRPTPKIAGYSVEQAMNYIKRDEASKHAFKNNLAESTILRPEDRNAIAAIRATGFPGKRII